MVSINERGFCKVWLNENFSSNISRKTTGGEKAMVKKIFELIEYHSLESKGSKKLFSLLTSSNSFLDGLKII